MKELFKKLFRWLFAKVPADKRPHVQSVAVLLFFGGLAIDFIIGLPAMTTATIALSIFSAPPFLLLGMFLVVGVILFVLLSLHILMPWKEMRRNLIRQIQGRFLRDEKVRENVVVVLIVSCMLGGIVFVVGATFPLSLWASNALTPLLDANDKTLIIMFGSFILQVAFVAAACLCVFSKEARLILKILADEKAGF